MSHFTVLVIGEDPEIQLEPYDEGLRVPQYDIAEVTESGIESFRDLYTTYDKDKSYGTFSQEEADTNKELSTKELYKLKGEDYNGNSWRWRGDKIIEVGQYNSNSKWDWYVTDTGRWSPYFILKDGSKGDVATVGEIDWDKMTEQSMSDANKRWQMVVDKVGVTNGKPTQPEFSFEYLRDKFRVDVAREKYHEQPIVKKFAELRNQLGLFSSIEDYNYTLEEYTNKNKFQKIVTHSVLNDGEWFEPGAMMMFGLSAASSEDEITWDANYFDRFIKDLDTDTLLTVFDCHI